MKQFLLLFCSLVAAAAVQAQSVIRIAKSGDETSTFDATSFAADAGQGRVFLETLRANLVLSGYFREAPPSSSELRLLGDARSAGAQLQITVQVVDRVQNNAKYGKRFSVAADQARPLAQQVADEILLALKNRKGFASSRIVLVGIPEGTRAKELFLVDPDGGDRVQLTRDNSVVLGPQWGPDGKTITYTSFHRGFPDLYQVDLTNGRRDVLSNFSGMNSGGAISPDGRSVALILSRDGKPELYVKDLRSNRLSRLTRTTMSAKSSPTWSPDGQRIAFVSGHGGNPHIYEVRRDGGRLRRLSTGGTENLSPDWGENGWIVFTRKQGPTYQVALMNPDTGETRMVSPADADYEDPAWAPDGRHIVCSRTVNYQSALYILDTGGNPPIALLRNRGQWYMPDWSP